MRAFKAMFRGTGEPYGNVWISKRDRRAFKAMFDLECKSIVLKEPTVVKDVKHVLNQDDASETD